MNLHVLYSDFSGNESLIRTKDEGGGRIKKSEQLTYICSTSTNRTLEVATTSVVKGTPRYLSKSKDFVLQYNYGR